MKALTLHQPWASLIAVGVKRIETRSWSTSYRGPLAIHAGLTYCALIHDDDPEGRLWSSGSHVLIEPKVGNEETWKHGNPFHRVPLGAVVATCDLVDVVPILPDDTVNPFEHTPCITVDPSALDNEATYGLLTYYERDATTGNDRSREEPFGDFTPGRFAWLLDNVVAFDEPVPARGRQQLWEWAA